MQVLCLCNNGMDLTAEIDYALEGVVDIAAAGGDGTGPGEAGKIREVVYAATLTVTQSVYKTVTLTSTTTMPALPAVTTTLVEYKTITITAAAAAQTAEPALTIETPAAVLTPAATKESMGKSSFPMSESDHVSIDPVETENQESQVFEGARGAATSDDVQPQLNEGPYGSFNEATWEVDPDAYQDPYLKEEFIEPIDDEQQAYEDEAEVEAEGEIEPLGNADHEDNLEDAVEENINLERQKHKSHDEDDDREDDNEDRDEEDDDRHKHKHIVDYEDMFPPFDIESEPLPKHTPHKHSHDDDKDKKKHHDRDRDESEDDDEEEEGDDDEDGDEDDVDEEEDDVDEDNDSLSRQ
ncbi:hypothetical protein EMPS_03124 [Entomortierella parvispora]|uniref:Uncharacterized protein n=1 Tax=Entomortierella parvispora TaxID=205924 RepID=A0A9P3H658_9FUNG|nr:hypothetical protein EMPS_03124 [Entomortierella parvispora]